MGCGSADVTVIAGAFDTVEVPEDADASDEALVELFVELFPDACVEVVSD